MTSSGAHASGHRPSLSVVVIGRNEGERLTRCLASVRALQWRQEELELLYVDSASRDDSRERAAAFGAEVIEARSSQLCAAVGRNLGWRRAAAPFVLFLDGDTIVHPAFVATALPLLADARIAVVWGHRRELYPRASVYQRVLDLDWLYPPGPSLFCGGDALMRRAALIDVNGFNEELIAGEEPELCQRLRARGYVIWHVDAPMTQHDLAITRWAQYWRRARRAGYAYAAVAQRGGADPKGEEKTEPPMSHGQELTLWLRESQRNLLHAPLLCGVGVCSMVFTLTTRSLPPLLLALTVYIALALRSAYRARWKSSDLLTLLLHGVHAHVQQIPIALGQLAYWRDYWRGRRRAVMDYKEARS